MTHSILAFLILTIIMLIILLWYVVDLLISIRNELSKLNRNIEFNHTIDLRRHDLTNWLLKEILNK